MGSKNDEVKSVRHGPYLVYSNASIIDIRTGKTIKKHVRYGKYVVGLRMKKTDKKCVYYQLHRLMYSLFVDSDLKRYDYVIPKDGNYLNLELNNWEKCNASVFHKENHSPGRQRIVSAQMKEKIIRLHEKGYSLRKIGAECGISSCTVHNVLTGKYEKKGT